MPTSRKKNVRSNSDMWKGKRLSPFIKKKIQLIKADRNSAHKRSRSETGVNVGGNS